MEKIISSAIKYPNGKIYIGKRHCDCFNKAFEEAEPRLPLEKIQGFSSKEGYMFL